MNKITIIPPGYNDEIFKPLSPQNLHKLKYHFDYKNIYNEERSIDLTDKKVVSSLGRVVRDKGFSELSRSMAEIMKDDPSVIFMVSGEIGNPVTQECREILKDVEDRVIFLPSLNQKEMARVYNVSSIFVMSSLNEAFGMVPIEAMGCKRPLLSDAAVSTTLLTAPISAMITRITAKPSAFTLPRRRLTAGARLKRSSCC